jgi:hypothetical protein
VTYRRSLSVLLELIETSASFETAQAQLEDAYREVESQAREFGARLGLGEEIRHIRVALSLGPAIESHSSKRSTNNLLLVHDLFSASGIFGAAP